MIVEAPWSTSSSSSNGQNGHSSSPTSNGHSSSSSAITPTIKSVYPSSFNKPDVLKAAAQFAFPCQTLSETVELFTFVLTNEDSKWTFGYCRHPPGAAGGGARAKSVCVFLTFLPWQEIFYRALNYLAEVVQEDGKLLAFLERMYGTQVPEPGTCLYVPTHQKPFICPCPSDLSLPSIPENVN